MINHTDVIESAPQPVPSIPQPTTPTQELPLPPSWERKETFAYLDLCMHRFCPIERRDPTGRIYYVDHNSRITTWTRPTGPTTAGASQRPLPQMADRRQIDDMHGNNTQLRNRASLAPTENGTTASGSIDNLGPLPSGWQMSKNDQGRMFFINHVLKKTTWVKKNFEHFN